MIILLLASTPAAQQALAIPADDGSFEDDE
jgi:hypothetical protein